MSKEQELVASNVASRTPEVEAMARFVAKHIVKTGKRGTIEEVELATRITEIEEETELLGADFVKVHVIDPDWVLQNSGFVTIDDEGQLDEIEIEFPEGSKRYWVLCAIEGSTELTEGNFVMTFQDKLFNDLRHYWGPKVTPPGTQTRAQFVHDLLNEAEIKAVIPGINKVQPVEEEKKGETGEKAIATALEKGEQHAEINKQPGPITRQSWAESLLQSGNFPVTKENLKAIVGWETQEGGAGPQFNVPDNTASYNPINTTEEMPGATSVNSDGVKAYTSWQQGLEATVKTLNNGHYPGILAALKEGKSSEAVGKAIAESPWGTSSAVIGSIAEAKAEGGGGVAVPGAGSSVAVEGASDVRQLKRGTDANPDEDSGECIKRLAQQVDWFAFSDGQRFYYMTGPELAHQKPVLRVDIPRNHIETARGHSEYGVIVAPTTYTFDQTTWEYQQSHKLRKKTQRRSKAVKPATPSEVKLHLVCEIGAYVSGQVIKFEHSGPISGDVGTGGSTDYSGRWVIVQTTRRCFKDVYTEIICEPPEEPLPEPKESGKEEVPGEAGAGGNGGGETGTALAAFEASSKLSEMELPYLWGGGHQANGLSEVKKGGPGLDCSGSTCWVLHEAGMFPATQAEVSGELENWGEAGEGKEMTVWASTNHVFIEFNVAGHERAQMNTNGPRVIPGNPSPPNPGEIEVGDGPRLYTLSKTHTYNMRPKAEGFTARHWKGT